MLRRYGNFARIGEGGMGVVYRAEDSTLKRQVAIKFLTTELLEDRSLRARLLREARLDAALNHPNICTVHEFGEVEPGEEDLLGDGTRLKAGTPFIVMEWIEGRTLQAILKEAGSLTLDALLPIAAQLSSALAAAHAGGIVHRDLKPGNVMVTEDGSVKVLDFGLAKSLSTPDKIGREDETLTADLTRAGSLLGTVAYMSPEQARGEAVGRRSDIFSLGIILYEMALGENPFRGSSQASTLAKILETAPPPIPKERSDLTEEFRDIVVRCLRKRPQDRFRDARELAGAFESIRSGSTAPPQAQQWPRWLVAVAVFGIVIGLAAVAWSLGWLTSPNNRAPEISSVAVLPCVTLTGDVQEDYFSEGITVDIITQLAKIGSLKVISPVSTLQYKEVDKNAAEIASELGVGSLLRCEAVRLSGRVRISARLIEPETEAVLWADSYDRSTEDILSVWSDVAVQIASKLRTALTAEEQELISRARQVDPDAYRAYLQGRLLWRERKRASIERAIEFFQEAITHDSGFAQAYAGLADAYESMARYAHGAVPFEQFLSSEREYGAKAMEAATRALELDPTLAGPHATIGHQLRWRHMGEAEARFRRAIELEPNYVWAHVWYGAMLSSQKRDDDAKAELELAASLAPTSQVVNAELAWVYAFAREYERAIALLRETIALDPSWKSGHSYLADVYLWASRYDEAREEYRMVLNMEAGGSDPFAMVLSALLGDIPTSAAVHHVAEIETFYGPMTAAELYAGLKETDLSLDALERAFEIRDPHLPARILREPLLDAVRSEPRYFELVERLGLTGYLKEGPR